MHHRRKYSFDFNIFDIIDSPEKSYWIGFLLGDGCVHKTLGTLSLELSNKDIDHLGKFKNFMEYDGPIVCTPKNCAVIKLNDTNFVKKLNIYGLIPNKTYSKILTPKIDNDLLRYFYLGLFDADGWFTLGKSKTGPARPEFGFSSYYPNILEEIKFFMYGDDPKRSKIVERTKNNQKVNQWVVGGINTFKYFGELYYNNNDVFLQRKKSLYDVYLHNYINFRQDKICA